MFDIFKKLKEKISDKDKKQKKEKEQEDKTYELSAISADPSEIEALFKEKENEFQLEEDTASITPVKSLGIQVGEISTESNTYVEDSTETVPPKDPPPEEEQPKPSPESLEMELDSAFQSVFIEKSSQESEPETVEEPEDFPTEPVESLETEEPEQAEIRIGDGNQTVLGGSAAEPIETIEPEMPSDTEMHPGEGNQTILGGRQIDNTETPEASIFEQPEKTIDDIPEPAQSLDDEAFPAPDTTVTEDKIPSEEDTPKTWDDFFDDSAGESYISPPPEEYFKAPEGYSIFDEEETPGKEKTPSIEEDSSDTRSVFDEGVPRGFIDKHYKKEEETPAELIEKQATGEMIPDSPLPEEDVAPVIVEETHLEKHEAPELTEELTEGSILEDTPPVSELESAVIEDTVIHEPLTEEAKIPGLEEILEKKEPLPEPEESKDRPEGWFGISISSLKEKISKTSETLISSVVSIVSGKEKIDEDILDEIEEKLIKADIGLDTAVKIVDNLRNKKHQITPEALKDHLKEEFSQILLKNNTDVNLNYTPGKLNVYLITGVNGVGKTTLIGKMAYRFKEQGKRVLIAAGDTFRAAAEEQLNIWSRRAGADIVRRDGADPASVVYDAIVKANMENYDVLLIDTAGRLHNKFNLMEELSKVKKIIDRNAKEYIAESMLVLDATTGQNGLQQARVFAEAVNLTSVALTKLDGSAKGGIIIAVAAEMNLPVKLVGVGEKIDDLRDFSPDDFIAALFS